MFKYSIRLAWSDEDQGYIATIPEVQGLSAFGETPEQAVSEAKVAAQGFLEIYEEDGVPAPEPKKIHQHSGQIRLRIPKELHGELAAEASAQGVSLNTYMVSRLSEQIGIEKVLRQLERPRNTVVTQIINMLPSKEHQKQFTSASLSGQQTLKELNLYNLSCQGGAQ